MSQGIYLSLVGSGVSILVAALGFFIISWMKRVEEAIRELSSHYVTRAVNEAKLQGHVDSLQKCIAQTNKDVGVLNSSVTKVWDIMIGSGMADKRPSDKFVGTGG